jgi:hypothetical protein
MGHRGIHIHAFGSMKKRREEGKRSEREAVKWKAIMLDACAIRVLSTRLFLVLWLFVIGIFYR